MTIKTVDSATPRRWASLPDAAEHIHVSQKTLRRMIASGDITGYRINTRLIRVDLEELEAALVAIPNARSI